MKFSELKIGDKFYDENNVGPYTKTNFKNEAYLKKGGIYTFSPNKKVYKNKTPKLSGKRYKSVKDLKEGEPHIVTKQYRRLNPEEIIKKDDYWGDKNCKNLILLNLVAIGDKVGKRIIWRPI